MLSAKLIFQGMLMIVSNIVTSNFLQFYFQNGRPPPNDLKEQCLMRINRFFRGHLDGLQMHGEIYISY